MTFHVRPSKNFANLGTLYQKILHVRHSNNHVNLGNLYLNIPFLGHGYFDDGSVFIAPRSYLRHDIFEARMKIAAQLLSTPVRQITAMEDKRSHGKRVIVVE
jgi:hypothetical protein